MVRQSPLPSSRRALLARGGALVAASALGLVAAACGGTTATTAEAPASTVTQTVTQARVSTVTMARTLVSTATLTQQARTVTAAPTGSVAKGAVTILYGTDYTDNADELKSYKRLLIDPFVQQQPNIQLEIVNGDAYTDKFKTALSAGLPWDVVWEADSSIYLQGFIQNISSYVAKDKFDTGVYPGPLFQQVNVWKGAINGLPNQAGGDWPVLPFNRVLLRKIGLDDPPATWGDPSWTWEKFREYCKKATTTAAGKPATFGLDNLGPGALVWDMPHLWGGQWISDDRTKVVCDSTETIACYNDYFALANQDGSMPKPGQDKTLFGISGSLKLFAAGKFEFIQTSGGGLSSVLDAVRKGTDMAYAPLPMVKNAGSFQWLDSNGLVTGSKHPDEAWTYIKWQAGTPNFALARGTVPPRTDFMADWAKKEYGDVGTAMRIEVYEQSLGFVNKSDPGWILPAFSGSMDKLIRKWISDVYAGKQTVEGGLRALVPQLQTLLDREDAKYKG